MRWAARRGRLDAAPQDRPPAVMARNQVLQVAQGRFSRPSVCTSPLNGSSGRSRSLGSPCELSLKRVWPFSGRTAKWIACKGNRVNFFTERWKQESGLCPGETTPKTPNHANSLSMLLPSSSRRAAKMPVGKVSRNEPLEPPAPITPLCRDRQPLALPPLPPGRLRPARLP
jgi:hypothetical protein